MQLASKVARTLILCGTLAACGGTDPRSLPEPRTEGDDGASAGAETTAPATETAPPEADEGSSSPWLAGLPDGAVLTYNVTSDDGEPRRVRMEVQQRLERGSSIAVRLAPIGTPLSETPVYPRWLIGSPDGLHAIEEYAAFTAPGFVPIDAQGQLVTEAASNQQWRVESEWLRPDRLASGREAAVGWTLVERVGHVSEPLSAERCVRLERQEGESATTLVICAGLGLVEEIQRRDDEVEQRWQLVSVGEMSSELE
jgi:hypothetical protein